MSEPTGSWEGYSKLVLKELANLSKMSNDMQKDVQDIKADLRSRSEKLDDVAAWKDKIDDIITPSQLRELKSQVQDLESFKTKSVTIFAVAQVLIAVCFSILSLFK